MCRRPCGLALVVGAAAARAAAGTATAASAVVVTVVGAALVVVDVVVGARGRVPRDAARGGVDKERLRSQGTIITRFVVPRHAIRNVPRPISTAKNWPVCASEHTY